MTRKYAFALAAFVLTFPPAVIAQSPTPTPDPVKPKIVSLQPAEPERITYDAGNVRYLATSPDTNGAWSLVELTEMPGYKTRLHRHIYTDESYYVLEGTLTAKIADKTYQLPAGSYILIPHSTPHAQGNTSKAPVRVLLMMTPAGFEESFRAPC